MKQNTIIWISPLLIFMAFSCKQHEQNPNVTINESENAVTTFADSIKYDVIIKPTDSEDAWEVERLQNFKQNSFIDYIFEQLYAGNFSAFDYETHKVLSIQEVKKIESAADFNRQNIGKIQFNEKWYIDSTGMLNKKINFLTLGIESYSNQKTFLGYKALFIVKFKPSDQ